MYINSLPQQLHVSYIIIHNIYKKKKQTHKENYCYLDIKVNEKGSSGKNLVCSERKKKERFKLHTTQSFKIYLNLQPSFFPFLSNIISGIYLLQQ